MATKALKHEDFTKEKRLKILNLTALPVRDKRWILSIYSTDLACAGFLTEPLNKV
jgi:hypothetical protein